MIKTQQVPRVNKSKNKDNLRKEQARNLYKKIVVKKNGENCEINANDMRHAGPFGSGILWNTTES